eukprot:CAMPEP_0176341076 /NCGR_PEP_ID=MMETSP0126-20121128/2073_1 /TAXON_ID=141414 ORGANISM="Strombidinopsis acuminatum, Strain SPMC142" /NCGR_SAMPLE_ID=MMETSP0126 /ASSEMBLY_ACC=CAM_ASM_000229 /LENGTH=73 /DNA_ID=CAMNT_0017685645 /DNA_START=1064 /DNA_END=1284 /DNA_ORIENTATION=+
MAKLIWLSFVKMQRTNKIKLKEILIKIKAKNEITLQEVQDYVKNDKVEGLITLENIFEKILQFEILDEGDAEV